MFDRNRRGFRKSSLAVLSCVTMVIGGGGLFFDMENSSEDALRLINTIRIFEFFDKDVFVVGVSAIPFHHKASEIVLRKAVNHKNIKNIFCRDKKT